MRKRCGTKHHGLLSIHDFFMPFDRVSTLWANLPAAAAHDSYTAENVHSEVVVMPDPVRVVGMPWYHREAYTRLRKLFKDGDKLPATFDQWLKYARQIQVNFERQGLRVVHAQIELKRFATWCVERGMDLDGRARLEWANAVALDRPHRTR